MTPVSGEIIFGGHLGKEGEMRVEEKDIVVLVYAVNHLFTSVVPLSEVKGAITVNCQEGIWFDSEKTAHQIGEHRYCGPDSVREGVIGVYDRSRTEQLSSMVYAVEEATRRPLCPLD